MKAFPEDLFREPVLVVLGGLLEETHHGVEDGGLLFGVFSQLVLVLIGLAVVGEDSLPKSEVLPQWQLHDVFDEQLFGSRCAERDRKDLEESFQVLVFLPYILCISFQTTYFEGCT